MDYIAYEEAVRVETEVVFNGKNYSEEIEAARVRLQAKKALEKAILKFKSATSEEDVNETYYELNEARSLLSILGYSSSKIDELMVRISTAQLNKVVST